MVNIVIKAFLRNKRKRKEVMEGTFIEIFLIVKTKN